MGDFGDRGAARALGMIRAFRAAIVLACAVGAYAAWIAGATTLVALALVVAIEETWETSVVASVLRREIRGDPSPRRHA